MLDAVRKGRQMPFLKRGLRCNMNGKPGRVTGASSVGLNIRVWFDGDTFSHHVHPQWEMTYYGNEGQVLADYTRKKGKT